MLLLFLASAAAVTLPEGIFSGADANGANYTFSFSSSLQCSTGGVASGVCQLFHGLSLSAGTFATQQVTIPAVGVVIVTYGDGTVCARTQGPRATTIVLACDPTALGLRVLSIAEDPLCQYTISAAS